MPRSRNSPASRQLRAKAFKEERIKNKEANQLPEERRVVIFRHEEFQEANEDVRVAIFQVAEPQVAEIQALQPPAIDQKVLEDRKRRAIEIFS
jgi:hypothetical protein